MGQDGRQRVTPYVGRVVEHDRPVLEGVEKIIARDPMHGLRRASDNRQVVGVGKGWHYGFGNGSKTGVAEAVQGGQNPVVQSPLNIGRVTAVNAHHNHRPARNSVGPILQTNRWG